MKRFIFCAAMRVLFGVGIYGSPAIALARPDFLTVRAQQIANALWNKTFTPCGEYFVAIEATNGNSHLYAEYKGPPRYVVVSDNLSAADRANGIEWQGEIDVVYPLERVSNWPLSDQQRQSGLIQETWRKWTDGGKKVTYLLRKVAAGWEIGPDTFFSSYQSVEKFEDKRPKCFDVPK